jgi:hypothetical protein
VTTHDATRHSRLTAKLTLQLPPPRRPHPVVCVDLATPGRGVALIVIGAIAGYDWRPFCEGHSSHHRDYLAIWVDRYEQGWKAEKTFEKRCGFGRERVTAGEDDRGLGSTRIASVTSDHAHRGVRDSTAVSRARLTHPRSGFSLG